MDDDTPIYSSQSVNNDYLTLKGIELRTKIKKDEIYTSATTGEALDNSIDYMETHGVKDPHVHVTISREEIKLNSSSHPIPLLKITVRNSVNPNSNHVFSKELLESIYKFGMYYSSKRFYKIHRGALGDASKLMLGASYALADSMNIDLTVAATGIYPITHKTSTQNRLKTFHVGLSSLENKKLEIIEDEETQSQENYTEVQILLPYDDEDSAVERRILSFLRDYVLLNTHIGFTFSFRKYNKQIHLPATQPMINNGKNLSSIHFYDLSEFRQMIRELLDKDQVFYDVFQRTFRGANNLPKNDLTSLTVRELQNSSAKIEELFNLMHDKVPAISEEPGQGLASIIPFSTTKKTRRRALEERLAQMGIFCDRVKYKQKYGYYKSDNGVVKYPYLVEVFVGHSKEGITNNLKVIQSINSKISNDTLVYSGPYKYGTSSNRYFYRANSIFDIFEHYKYSCDKKKCKKPNSIISVNLISPRVSYKSHGKSGIDHTPFAKTIAATVVEACRGGSDKNGKVDQIVGLREVLKKRKEEYLAIQDPIERKRRELSQSDIFYATRMLLINVYGYTDKEINRDYLTRSIRDESAKLGVTREQIGIIAADRAQLYFKGKWFDVGLDEIDTLVDYGTDMVIIEKEGIIMRVSPYSNKNRISLLNTRGFLVEYASKLAKLANEKGCNISIIVDWDVSGLLIFLKLRKIIPGLKRIGVDFETLEDLGLNLEDVQEEYTPNKDHLDPLKKELDDAIEDARINGNQDKEEEYISLKRYLSYLKTNRIEINSITAQLKDNEKFYNWIEDKLRDAFPDRDFTRMDVIPEYVTPNDLQGINDIIKEIGTAAFKPRREELQDKLANNSTKNAFLFDRTNTVKPDYDTDDYEAAIAEQSKKIIQNSDELKPYLEKIMELHEQLKQHKKQKD
jgi:hypothetical protein